MNHNQITINTPYITLGQLLKFIGLIDCGSYAKDFLLSNEVFVNEIVENRRGKKIYPGDMVKICDVVYVIKEK